MTAPKQRLITMAVAMMLGTGLAGCADDASNLGGGTTAGTTGGATGGNTSGNTAGNTAGDTGGNTSGNTAGNTGGDTAGNTAGNTGGNTAGDTAGNTGGNTAGDTAGDTGGNTAGDTSGNTAGDTGGNTSGDTAGNTAGDTGGDTSGDTGGDTAGDTAGDTGGDTGGGDTGGGDTGGTTGDVVGGIICNPTSPTFRPIVLPNATAIGSVEGLCLGCSVGTPIGVIDDNPLTVGSLNVPVGLLGGSSVLTVTDTATIYPAGRRAGFTIFDPAGALLTLTLLQTVEVTAIGNGGVQDTANATTLTLDLLGTPIIGDTDPRFIGFVPNIEFSSLAIRFGSVANVLAQIGVIQACVSVEPALLP